MLAGVSPRPLLRVEPNRTVPLELLGVAWNVAVYVTVTCVPQLIPALDAGLTAMSTEVTLKGTSGAVGCGVGPPALDRDGE